MSLNVLSVGYPFAPVAEDTAGGAEQILGILDEALVQAGHRSIVIAPDGSHCRGALLPTERRSGPLDEAARVRAHREYRDVTATVVRHYRIDVIHMHGIDFLDYLPATSVPVVVTLHLPLSWYPEELFSKTRDNLHLVCVSECQRNLGPNAASHWRVIRNGVRLERNFSKVQKQNYVVSMGRICPEKGFHLALDAATEADVSLFLAGQVFGYKAHEEYFESMIRPRLAGPHRFLGAVGGRQKTRLLAEARCLIVPSLVNETSCLVAMEALACGTPVVGFRRGALPEVVEEGVTGFLVDTPEELPHAIRDTAGLRSEICRARAEEKFSAEPMIQRYLHLYEELLSDEHDSISRWQEAA